MSFICMTAINGQEFLGDAGKSSTHFSDAGGSGPQRARLGMIFEDASLRTKLIFPARRAQCPAMNLDHDRGPVSFAEALAMLDTALTLEEKGAWSNMTAARMFDLQARLARVLKRDWSLDDSGTPLRMEIRSLGLDDAEEVSLLLIDAFWRKYNNEPIPLESLVREYLED